LLAPIYSREQSPAWFALEWTPGRQASGAPSAADGLASLGRAPQPHFLSDAFIASAARMAS
jgi:hypothetical protein